MDSIPTFWFPYFTLFKLNSIIFLIIHVVSLLVTYFFIVSFCLDSHFHPTLFIASHYSISCPNNNGIEEGLPHGPWTRWNASVWRYLHNRVIYSLRNWNWVIKCDRQSLTRASPRPCFSAHSPVTFSTENSQTYYKLWSLASLSGSSQSIRRYFWVPNQIYFNYSYNNSRRN